MGAALETIVGWDIGGANVKVAVATCGRILDVLQIPCPPVADRSKFASAISEALTLLPDPARHAVTMTGELSDVFASRAEGVAWLVALAEQMLNAGSIAFYGGRAGLLTADLAGHRPLDVASANWHATACHVGQRHANALLIDIGTTTTDIIPIAAGRCAAAGYTDAERLASGELVYTGVVRTPVMAVAQTAPFDGVRQGLVAERFATMADVYRLTGGLPTDADQSATADNRSKSRGESAARLARMTGRDAGDAPEASWIELAHFVADAQLARIESAAADIARRSELPFAAPIVGAGCGRFLARVLAERLQRPYMDFGDVIECDERARENAARCAPAVSVALIAAAGQPAPPSGSEAFALSGAGSAPS